MTTRFLTRGRASRWAFPGKSLGTRNKSLDYFGLYWELDSASSVGRYGEVSFYNDDSLIGEFDWGDVAENVGSPWWSFSDSYINFHADPEESFNKIVLNATWWAQFESDNHAYRVAASSNSESVPEPSCAIGLLGIAAIALRSKGKAIVGEPKETGFL